MYYPCSENKGADQLRGYREADLRLCFRIGKNPVFSRCGSVIIMHYGSYRYSVVLSKVSCHKNKCELATYIEVSANALSLSLSLSLSL